MSVSMHRATIPVLVRGLRVLSALIDKAATHALDTGIDPATLVDARLAPDMLTLAGQVQRASDTSKLSAERLSGLASPKLADDERTLDDLRARIAKTIAYLDSVDEAAMAGSEARTIVLNFGNFKPTFTGADYLFVFALPNFYFHVTTALRHPARAGRAGRQTRLYRPRSTELRGRRRGPAPWHCGSPRAPARGRGGARWRWRRARSPRRAARQ